MTFLHKEKLKVRLLHVPFDYPVHSYRISLVDYFVRALEIQMH